jgi:hypothetical protein
MHPLNPLPWAFSFPFIPFLDFSICPKAPFVSPPDTFYLRSLGLYNSFLDTFKPLPGLFNYPWTLPCTALPGLFHVLPGLLPIPPKITFALTALLPFPLWTSSGRHKSRQ